VSIPRISALVCTILAAGSGIVSTALLFPIGSAVNIILQILLPALLSLLAYWKRKPSVMFVSVALSAIIAFYLAGTKFFILGMFQLLYLPAAILLVIDNEKVDADL
jgi:hypothetical protein